MKHDGPAWFMQSVCLDSGTIKSINPTVGPKIPFFCVEGEICTQKQEAKLSKL